MKNESYFSAFDEALKVMLERFFPDFFRFFFPEIVDTVDWERGYEFKEEEFRQLLLDVKRRRIRYPGTLIKVSTKDGNRSYLYVHIKAQLWKDPSLPEEVFICSSSVFGHYLKRAVSFVVLGDSDPEWRPDRYEYALFGCEIELTYLTVKLLDYRTRMDEITVSGNPFAFFVIAHLKALEAKDNVQEMLEFKEAVVKEVNRYAGSKEDIQTLLKAVDLLMRVRDERESDHR